jgi:alpha-ketoglutarate-dependent taurine dioxygenase
MTDPSTSDFLLQFGSYWMPEKPVINVRIDEEKQLKGFHNGAVPPHNECCHEKIHPLWIALQCMETAKEGGQFYLIDSREMMRSIDAGQLNQIKKTSFLVTSPKTGYFETRNLFKKHPLLDIDDLMYTTIGRKSQLKHGFKSLNKGGKEVLHVINRMLLTEKKYYLMHNWQKGDLLIFDNYRFLHGRHAFEGKNRFLKHIRLVPKKKNLKFV